MKRNGTIIVLSGPSGVGKSTLVSRVRERIPELEFSVSCTTRKPRPGEKHGEHYYFLERTEFQERIARGEFIEYAEVFANFYGTLQSEVMERIRRGNPVLLDIDTQGALGIRERAKHDPELARAAMFVFLGPPSLKTLEERLRNRATESEEQLRLRIEGARRELSCWKHYDYLVINDDLERAAEEMTGLFRSFALRTASLEGEVFDA